MHFTYIDPLNSYTRSLYAMAILSLAAMVIALALLLRFRWLREQTAGQEKLERRAKRILSGERENAIRSEGHEWPPFASRAMDHLLAELAEVTERKYSTAHLVGMAASSRLMGQLVADACVFGREFGQNFFQPCDKLVIQIL